MEENKEEKVDETKSEKSESCHRGHGLKVVLVVLVCLLVIGGIAGVAKLAFGRREFSRVNVQRNAMMQRGSFGGGRMMAGRGIRSQTGTNLIGKINKINGDNVTIHKDSNNKDYTVVISDTTQIRKDGEIAGKTDLANGLAITAQGSANSSGEILANIIIIN